MCMRRPQQVHALHCNRRSRSRSPPAISMCGVSRRCSQVVLALQCVPPLVALLAHAHEDVRCGACRALLQLCK
jgi:hypothetical protein